MKGTHTSYVVILMLTSWSAAQAAVIDDYTATSNDRFANSVSFVGNEFDWTGVGLTSAGRWATLIGPNTIISANHFHPSGAVRFYPSNDSTQSSVLMDIASGERLGESDLWLGCLEERVPETVRPVPIATETITTGNFASSLLRGATAFMMGRSHGVYPTVLDQAVGQNQLAWYGENVSVGLGANVDVLSLIYDAAMATGDSNPLYSEFETYLEVGDSGAPVLLPIDDQLMLVGVNSFVTIDNQTGAVRASLANYVGNESEDIEEFVQFCLTTVPEPATGGLIVLAVLLVCATPTAAIIDAGRFPHESSATRSCSLRCGWTTESDY